MGYRFYLSNFNINLTRLRVLFNSKKLNIELKKINADWFMLLYFTNVY